MSSILIPAAGSAERMRGLPKFLLPSGEGNLTMLETHLLKAQDLADEILIGVNPVFIDLLLKSDLNLQHAEVLPITTSSMVETVLNLVNISNADRFMVIMPDSGFLGQSPYKFIMKSQADLTLGLWKIREEQKGKLGQIKINKSGHVVDSVDKDPECSYKFCWGLLSFSRNFLKFIEPTFPHFGFAILKAIKNGVDINKIIIDGTYWDCGTPQEYVNYLRMIEN